MTTSSIPTATKEKRDRSSCAIVTVCRWGTPRDRPRGWKPLFLAIPPAQKTDIDCGSLYSTVHGWHSHRRSEMQRSIVGSAWEIQASRLRVGMSRIVGSGRDRMGRSSASRVSAWAWSRVALALGRARWKSECSARSRPRSASFWSFH